MLLQNNDLFWICFKNLQKAKKLKSRVPYGKLIEVSLQPK